MVLLSGKEPALKIKKECKQQAERFYALFNRRPCLAVILAGNNPSSMSYVRSKQKACDFCLIEHRDINLPAETQEEELLSIIDSLNADPAVDGILVQLPLPAGIDPDKVIKRIDPAKDADGFSPENVGKLLLGEKTLVPCTPAGVLEILDYYDIPTKGRNVCMVGRSNIVGKPMAALLMQKGRDATVTVCHSRTPDIARFTKEADIVIVATGMPETVTSEMVKEGAVVIDVGITRIEDKSEKGYHWEGDADFEGLSLKCSALTPVPGGVGLMTVAMLMKNTVQAAFGSMEKA